VTLSPAGPTTNPTDAPPRPVSPPPARQAAEPPAIHCGHAYQPLSAAAVGNDELQWAIPTQVENSQLQEERGPDDEVEDPPVEDPPPVREDQRGGMTEKPPSSKTTWEKKSFRNILPKN